jgi:hypothetical protein
MSESEKPTSRSTTRREIVKAAFVAPAIITLAVMPAFASAGSRDYEPREHDRDRHEKKHRPRRGDD